MTVVRSAKVLRRGGTDPTVLEGSYSGLHLSFPALDVCSGLTALVRSPMRPVVVVFFLAFSNVVALFAFFSLSQPRSKIPHYFELCEMPMLNDMKPPSLLYIRTGI